MKKIKLVNVVDEKPISVPFAHAMDVLLPQKQYVVADPKVQAILTSKLLNEETGQPLFSDSEFPASKQELVDMCRKAEISYSLSWSNCELFKALRDSRLLWLANSVNV